MNNHLYHFVMLVLAGILFIACSSTGGVMTRLDFDLRITEPAMNAPYNGAFAPDGSFYILDAGNDRILHFNRKGKLLDQWDGVISTMGFGALTTDAEGNIYSVSNAEFMVKKFNPEGELILSFGSEGVDAGQFSRAIGIAVDSSGKIFVTDDAIPYVQVFNSDGSYLYRFGGKGDGEGSFSHPTGIAVSTDGFVYVADYELKIVQKFTVDGSFILQWGTGSDLNRRGTPEGIAIAQSGEILVSDYHLARIEVFSPDGTPLLVEGAFGSNGDGKFVNPSGIAVGPGGRVLVVDQKRKDVQVFRSK